MIWPAEGGASGEPGRLAGADGDDADDDDELNSDVIDLPWLSWGPRSDRKPKTDEGDELATGWLLASWRLARLAGAAEQVASRSTSMAIGASLVWSLLASIMVLTVALLRLCLRFGSSSADFKLAPVGVAWKADKRVTIERAKSLSGMIFSIALQPA